MIVVALILVAVAVAAIAVAWRASRRADVMTDALSRLSDALVAGDDREQLMAVALDTARALTGAKAAALWLDIGAAVVVRMVRGEPVVAVNDRVPYGTTPPCTMSATLHARNRDYGVLCLYGGDTGRRGALREFVDRVDAAIEATYAHEEARKLSITDGLTGLWNRRQFDIRCVEELDRAVRFREPFAVVLCDIDDFKRINDTRGHLVGDAVLVEVAKRLVDNTRGVDLVARYGGEEFGLVLPRTDIEGAMRVADHVREVIAATPVQVEGASMTVTISAGIACHPVDGTTIPALTAAADAGLYVAKGAGKNQVRPAPATESR